MIETTSVATNKNDKSFKLSQCLDCSMFGIYAAQCRICFEFTSIMMFRPRTVSVSVGQATAMLKILIVWRIETKQRCLHTLPQTITI